MHMCIQDDCQFYSSSTCQISFNVNVNSSFDLSRVNKNPLPHQCHKYQIIVSKEYYCSIKIYAFSKQRSAIKSELSIHMYTPPTYNVYYTLPDTTCNIPAVGFYDDVGRLAGNEYRYCHPISHEPNNRRREKSAEKTFDSIYSSKWPVVGGWSPSLEPKWTKEQSGP